MSNNIINCSLKNEYVSNIVSNQINDFKKFEEENKKYIREKIRKYYEELDLQIRARFCKKYNGYIAWGKRPITLITEWGPITFRRTLFRYWENKNLGRHKYVFLLDKEIGKKPWERISFDFYIKIIQELDSGKRYRDIFDKFKNSEISLMTISNINRKINFREVNKNFSNIKENKINFENNYLYVGVDDTYTNLFAKNKKLKQQTIRMAYCHTGIKKENNNRNKLINKKILLTMNKSAKIDMKKYTNLLTNFIENNYDIDNKKVIVMGDGAKWIPELARNLQAEIILDKFHLIKNVYSIFSFRKNTNENKLTEEEKKRKIIYYELKKFADKGEVNNLISYLNGLLQNHILKRHAWLKEKRRKINKLINYIKNNEEGINNYKKDYYIGSQTESQISHNIKALKSYGAKAYNEKTFSNMLAMKMAKVNGWDIINLLKEKKESTILENQKLYYQNIWSKKGSKEYKHKQGQLHTNSKNLFKYLMNSNSYYK